MRRGCFVCCVALAFVLMTGTLSIGGGKVENYSAEQVHMRPDGKVENVSKLFGAPHKMRMEMASPGGQDQMIVIVREDKKVQWTLIPEKKAYMEHPISEGDFKMLPGTVETINSKEEDLGSETVNGFKCRKKRVETTVRVMGFEQTSRSTVWTCDEFPMPIRTKSESGEMTEIRNIKKGNQPDHLFEVPSGYRKIANIMEAM